MFLAALFQASAALADCAPNATPAQIEASRAKTLKDPNVSGTTTEENYLKITIKKPEGIVLSYFTLPAHPAHPANVLTAIYEAEGRVRLHSRGFTAGDCKVFEQWMKSFEKQHERVRQTFRHSGSPAVR